MKKLLFFLIAILIYSNLNSQVRFYGFGSASITKNHLYPFSETNPEMDSLFDFVNGSYLKTSFSDEIGFGINTNNKISCDFYFNFSNRNVEFDTHDNSYVVNTKLKIYYVDLNMLLRYNFANKMYLGFGTGLGIQLYSRSINTYRDGHVKSETVFPLIFSNISTKFEVGHSFKNFEYSLLLDNQTPIIMWLYLKQLGGLYVNYGVGLKLKYYFYKW